MIKVKGISRNSAGKITDQIERVMHTLEVDKTGGHGLIITLIEEDLEFGNEAILKIFLEAEQVEQLKREM